MLPICMHCFITGRVQGVSYRQTTYQEAVIRGIQGWVRNCPDGRVEAMLQGERKAVEQLRDWLWRGSPASEVTSVESQEAQSQPFTQFEVR
jgi:acylphosphatase